MTALDVKRLLGRYRDLVDRTKKELEKGKGAAEPLASSMIIVCGLELKNLDEAVEWLDRIAEGTDAGTGN